MPKDIVHARASTYRGAGIRLKKMPRHQNKALDVERLNAIIDELNRQSLREGGKNFSSGSREGGDVSQEDRS